MYKALLHNVQKKQTEENEYVINLFTEMMQVSGANTSDEVVQKFLNREQTLETVKNTEEELDQRLNKLLKEKKILENQVNMPDSILIYIFLEARDLDMRNVYKQISTKEEDLNKLEANSNNVKNVVYFNYIIVC